MKKHVFGWTILLCLLLCGTALAAGSLKPVNPYFLDRGKALLIRPRHASEITVALDTPDGFHYGPTTWTLSAEGGVAPYTYTVQLCSFELKKYGDDLLYTTFYTTDYQESSVTVDLLVPGEYVIFVTATDSTGESSDYHIELYDLEEDASHPSVEKIAASLARQAMQAGDDDYARALWAHDYIINHAYYDLTYSHYGADGVLLRGTGVCDSYSKALTIILRECGIAAGRVYGEDHGWVIARLDGEWYMIDPTWDDPAGSAQPVSGHEAHRYFGITTDMVCADHDIVEFDAGYDHLCESLEDNYYYRSGISEFCANDSRWTSASLVEQVEAMLQSPGLEKTLEVPGVYQEGPSGFYIESPKHCMWPVVAYALGKRQWVVNDEAVPVMIHYDIAADRMTAMIDIDQLPCATLPKTVLLDEEIFMNAASLRHVVVAEGVTRIAANAFAHCAGLRCVDLPASVTEIDAAAFAGSELVAVRAPAGSFAAEWAIGQGIPVIER